ncbi:MAG: DNA primase [Clostridia bacterium]|nr:DNA primase [Clostridia bacterium]
MAFSQEWMDELLSKNEITEVISSYVALKPKGRKLWACCPLHGEKTPSFSVSPDKQLFYCFGCHAGGTVIQFIMDMEHLSFIEAVKLLAERAHMELPEERNDRELSRQRAYRERLYEVNRAAARFYCEQLLGEKGQPGRDYAQKRGLVKDIILRFGIGYAPEGWDNLMQHMEKQGFLEKELLDAGLLVKNPNSGRVYDAYRNRLMYPIQGVGGQVLGFGGRVLDDSKPKYINTGDTPIYNKRNNLYGLHLQKGSKLTDLIMVEGYMDVIGLYKAGVTNAVASLGTALTEQQARLLKRYVDTVYIAYDGDAAGQNATIRGLEILSQQGLSVRVIVFPDDLDPDEYVQIYGKEGFDNLKQNAFTLNAFKIETLAREQDLDTEDGREQFALKACAFVGTLQPVEQERYFKLIAQKTGYELESIREQGRRDRTEGQQPQRFFRTTYRKPQQEEDAKQKYLRTMLTCALKDRRAHAALAQAGVEDVLEGVYAEVFLAMAQPNFQFPAYVAAQDRENAQLLTALIRQEQDMVEPEKTALDCLHRLRQLNREQQRLELQQQLTRTDITEAERSAILKQITELIRGK